MPNFGVTLNSLSGLRPKFGVNYAKITFIILGPGFEDRDRVKNCFPYARWMDQLGAEVYYYVMINAPMTCLNLNRLESLMVERETSIRAKNAIKCL